MNFCIDLTIDEPDEAASVNEANEAASALLLMHEKTFSQKENLKPTRPAIGPSFAENFIYHKRKAMVRESSNREPKRRRFVKKQRRSVRFEQEAVPIHVYERVKDHEASSVWWTRQELAHIHRRERSMVKILACYCHDYLQHLDRLVDVSSSAGGIMEETSSSLWIANGPGRGLEPQVMQILDGKNHGVKRVVLKVLDTHKQLEEYGDLIGSSELRRGILRAQCEKQTRSKVRFAQLVAGGDSQLAQMR